MTGGEQENYVRARSDPALRRGRIRRLNDQLRKYRQGGIVVLSRGVVDLGNARIAAVLQAVREFDAFTPDNDPHQEHDLGIIKLPDLRVMWKIDYYDLDRVYGSPDPADPAVTTRVLTIMLASEY